MIRKIIINNIQSHKHTEIDFTEGVNAIIGSSCSGKTAILRSLYWVIENRPTGTSILCSNWNKDKKGNVIDEMSVTLVTEKGFVKRYRNTESNGYIVHYADGNEVKLEAIKTDVPDEVSEFLNLTDINVQKQLDAPFLLSDSAPEAARYLNNIVHLDSIDTTLARADKNKREVSQNIKYVGEQLNADKLKLSKYDYLDDANKLLEKVERYNEQAVDIGNKWVELANDLRQFNEVKDYSKELDLISRIEKFNNQADELCDEIQELNDDISCFKNVIDYSKELELIEKIDSIEIPDNSELEDDIDDYEYNLNKIKKCEIEIEKLKEQLPEVCPTCGRPLGEHKCD